MLFEVLFETLLDRISLVNVVNNSKCYLNNGENHTVPLEQHYEQQKEEELFVVSSADACAKPFTMMVKVMSAVTTEITMKGSLWPEDEASVAVLHPSQVIPSFSNGPVI